MNKKILKVSVLLAVGALFAPSVIMTNVADGVYAFIAR
jgi:hypothetical protein